MWSFFNISNQVSYLKELIWGASNPCTVGDIACEMTDGKYNLPTTLSNLLAKGEEFGVSRYISGSAALLIGFGVIGMPYLYKKYSATTPLDLVRNIIKKEFGPFAAEIFEAFKKAIEDAIDKVIKDIAGDLGTNTEGMSKKDLEDTKAKLMQSRLEAILPTLATTLKSNKVDLEQAAKAIKDEAKSSKASQVAATSDPVLDQKSASVKPSAKLALSAHLEQLLFPANTSKFKFK
ncbi:MAG: hypothetical protein BGO43_03470 [Gammaproteobacteria bacterium 39-13]|nr:hypothetical protein [Gammaproteobacteria bacterium]OJV92073.1 MAG: hypothetical protein BGO43_03470 [Gammaproteobacteria bacterium 39-13]